jgi:UDP-glucose 4-epimerase
MTTGPILVTGAGGFVCSEVALALHRAGHEVVAVDHIFDAATSVRLKNIHKIEGELATILNTLGPCAAVIHGAAITASPERLGITRAAHIRRNMDLLTATLEFAQSAGASRFLFVSSMGVFEPHDTPTPNGWVTELTHPTADCTYCAAKHAGELLTASAATTGFETLSLRLGNIFGPHEAVRESRQHLCLVARMVAEARDSGIITVQTPEAHREWAWLPDLADAIVRLIGDPWEQSVLHAGAPPVMSDLDLARAVVNRMPRTSIRLSSPPHAAIRPPMASSFQTALTQTQWTAMAAALDRLIPLAVMP